MAKFRITEDTGYYGVRFVLWRRYLWRWAVVGDYPTVGEAMEGLSRLTFKVSSRRVYEE